MQIMRIFANIQMQMKILSSLTTYKYLPKWYFLGQKFDPVEAHHAHLEQAHKAR